MSALQNIKEVVFPKAFALLPPIMESDGAKAEILAIGLQESRFEHRVQIGGPAHGFFQFEKGGGVRGVLNHHSTKDAIHDICVIKGIQPNADACYEAIVNDDVLAVCFARLLLWTVPGRFAKRDEPELGWKIYINGWRPGLPHRHTWDAFFEQAWMEVAP